MSRDDIDGVMAMPLLLEPSGQPALLRVLVIDDDPDDVELISDALTESGWPFEVNAATEPTLARTLILSGRYDAFVIDWRLGAESGIDIVAELAAKASGPMIAITGRHDVSVDRAAQAAGAFDYLQKDRATPEVLSRAIRYSVQAWRERQRFQAIFDQAPVGLLRTTPDGTIEDANPAMSAMFGTNLEGRNAGEFHVDPKAREEVVAALRRGEGLDDITVEMRRDDGSRLWASVRYRGSYDDGGELAKLYGTFRDITDHRRLAEQTRLEERHRTVLEQEHRIYLEEAARLKDEFFSLISHELRTPLTSIIGYVELLRHGLDVDATERFLEIVDRNARRLHHLVDDLLFVARLEAGEMNIELSEMNLRSVAADCVEAALPHAESRGVVLALRADPVVMVGDPSRVGQVIDNLVSNALKFTPPGGRVEVAVEEEADWATIMVSDTGEGISAEELPNLFQRFYRTPSAMRRVVPGTGLGLTIVKAIVEAHGGSVDVESDPGECTAFTLHLPIGGPTPVRSINERKPDE